MMVSFDLLGGDAMRVAGTNGSGKTSLLRMLCGLSVPAQGQIRWNGLTIQEHREEFARDLLYLGHANGVKDDLIAWENVVISATLSGRPITRDQAYEALDQLGLAHAADLPTRALSQGQRKRVAMARLQFAATTPLWILDEPFTALDFSAVTTLCATMSTHLLAGGMIIYTTHQEVGLRARRTVTLDLTQNMTQRMSQQVTQQSGQGPEQNVGQTPSC